MRRNHPEEIREYIRELLSKGQFVAGHKYIQSLAAIYKTEPDVVIAITEFYLTQGQYILADDACKHLLSISQNDRQQLGSGEEIACLEILSAYVDIQRYGLFKTSLATARRIGKLWHLEDEILDYKTVTKLGGRVSLLSKNVRKLQLGPKMSESRTLLSLYYWKIIVESAQQGFYEAESVKRAAVEQMERLQQYADSEGWIRVSRLLITFRISLIHNQDVALKILELFLTRMAKSSWQAERAMTLVDIGEIKMKVGLANGDSKMLHDHDFREASDIFNAINHTYGCIAIDELRISLIPNISAGDRFLLKIPIAKRYLAAGNLQDGIRVLAMALSPELILKSYHNEVADALELMETAIQGSGSELLKQASLFHSISQAVSKATEVGYAVRPIEAYLAYFTKMPQEIGPKTQSRMAVLFSNTYANFGDHEQALRWAENALIIAKTSHSYVDCSNAALNLGVHQAVFARAQPSISSGGAGRVEAAITQLTAWAESNARNGYLDGKVAKCLQIAELLNWRGSQRHGPALVAEERSWIERAKKHIPKSNILKRDQAVNTEIRTCMKEHNPQRALTIAREILADIKMSPQVTLLTKAQAHLRAAQQAHIFACSQLSLVQRTKKYGSPQALKEVIGLIIEALDLGWEALKIFRATDGAGLVISCTVYVSDLLKTFALMSHDTTHINGLVEKFREELLQTEQFCDRTRRSVDSTEGLQSLMHRRKLVANQASLDLYDIGIYWSLDRKDSSSAWWWLQRGKARAFAGSIGARVAIPQALLERTKKDRAASMLLSEEQRLLRLLGEFNASHIINSRKLAAVRMKMVANPLLAEIVNIQQGVQDTSQELPEMQVALEKSGIAPKRLKYVEWYFPQRTQDSESPIVLFVRQFGSIPKTRKLKISVSTVERWISRAFQFPEGTEPPLSRKNGNHFLAEMEALVSGLDDFTDEDDLLIFSPSDILNKVPIHGLKVEGKPLIERNLVVYSTSEAVMHHSVTRANISIDNKALARNYARPIEPAYMGIYEDKADPKERTHIYQHIERLAQTISGSYSLGTKVTKPYFREKCETSTWLHYHGHAIFNKDQVLESALCLSDGEDDFSPGEQQLKGTLEASQNHGKALMTISDIFALNAPRRAVHHTIIGCDSGTQHIAPGNEPLGVIPALIYAGATSVLGCQWPIESRAGRVFSECFYTKVADAIARNTKRNDVRVINIAQAVRGAVADMRAGVLGAQYKQPYYWASFSLFGVWYFPS